MSSPFGNFDMDFFIDMCELANFQTHEENQTFKWIDLMSIPWICLHERLPVQLRIVFFTTFFHQIEIIACLHIKNLVFI